MSTRLLAARAALLIPIALAACAPAVAVGPAPGPRSTPERTGYEETTSHADAVAILEVLAERSDALRLDTLGRSADGRVIPLVVASRAGAASAEEARASGLPIVWVQGNIHGGEVEGKEALLALLRDLAADSRPNVLDSLVLLAVPIYNPDGNERWGPQERNRSEQNGPPIIGERANGQGLDLNRDYMKADAPETRASLAAFRAWEPDVFVDLHATNGSYHGYALTYSPSLTPAAGEAGEYARDRMLPELRLRMRERRGFETFDYGNFSLRYGADVNTDTVKEAWYTYDHRPRYGTNYYGLRGGISILGEAYSHDPFARRIASSRAFVEEILAFVAERPREILAVSRAERRPARVPIRAELTRTPYMGDVVAEDLALAEAGAPVEPGVAKGLRRTGRFRTLRIPVFDRFDATLERSVPRAYALAPEERAAAELLRAHGIVVEQLTSSRAVTGEALTIEELIVAERPFQGHREVRLTGRWTASERVLPAGSYWIPGDQPRIALAAYLLEPESDDGLTTWSAPEPAGPAAGPRFARPLQEGGEHPVLRVH